MSTEVLSGRADGLSFSSRGEAGRGSSSPRFWWHFRTLARSLSICCLFALHSLHATETRSPSPDVH